jgi:hypothetical protein
VYKFNIGQTVYLAVSLERFLAVSGGTYVITKRLPEHDGEFEYQIKSVNEPHERVARESQLNGTLAR